MQELADTGEGRPEESYLSVPMLCRAWRGGLEQEQCRR